MRFTARVWFALIVLSTIVGVPRHLSAQHTRYKLIDIGTLGGPTSIASEVNNNGTLIGVADTTIPDPNCISDFCLVQHALRWKRGNLIDLGALRSPLNNSSATFLSDSGFIAGNSYNGVVDPLLKTPEQHAVLWTKSGGIIDLGTLGGTQSIANTVNNRGEVVGGAANSIPDPFSEFGFATQTRAFLWAKGVMHDLGTLGGPDAVAVGINDAGEVEGFASTSSTPNSFTGGLPFHPFLWKNGRMIDLGTIGGSGVAEETNINGRGQFAGEMTLADETTVHPFVWDGQRLIDIGTFGGDFGGARAINQAGEVTGFARITGTCPDGGPIAHAFLWRRGVKLDLGAIPGVTDRSLGFGINSRSQVVGVSFSCDLSIDAFLWEKGGSMVDLNTLIPAGSPLHLVSAQWVNERGEIAGLGVLPDGDFHGFLLVPCGPNSHCAGISGASTRLNARQQLAVESTFSKRVGPRVRDRRTPLHEVYY